MDALLTSAQVAEFLQIKTATLSDWRNQNKGPIHVECGAKKQIRYLEADVMAWVRSNRVTCASTSSTEEG
jgi:predicted DNA-binding transcriptional regulator AlpA